MPHRRHLALLTDPQQASRVRDVQAGGEQLFSRRSVYCTPAEVGKMKGGHAAVFVLPPCPGGNTEKPVMIHRQHSTDPRADARVLVDMLRGGDGDDARN